MTKYASTGEIKRVYDEKSLSAQRTVFPVFETYVPRSGLVHLKMLMVLSLSNELKSRIFLHLSLRSFSSPRLSETPLCFRGIVAPAWASSAERAWNPSGPILAWYFHCLPRSSKDNGSFY